MARRLIYLVNDPVFFLSHRLPLAKRAMSSGFEVHVSTPVGEGIERIKKEGFRFHEIPLFQWSTKAWQDINTFQSLVRLYKTVKPDIVHHITIKPVLYGGLAARLARIPAVVSAVTGLGYVFLAQGFQASILRAGVKKIYRLALGHKNSRVIFQNPDDKQEFLENDLVDKCKAIIIRGSGVDMDKFVPAPEPDDPPVVLLASRMLADKGIQEFVEAAKILKDSGTKARFVLVGDTIEANPVTVSAESLEQWNREGFIEWWGWKDNMEEIFAQAHIVCLPSYREGAPKVLIEAAASGKPIVATDVPGCREIVKHNQNGFLVPVCDGAALAESLKLLIENPQLRKSFGKAGRKLAEAEFSEEKVINETLDVYNNLLENSNILFSRSRRRFL